MDISPLGHSSFKIKTKLATLVTDPYDSQLVGLKFPKHIEADIVTVSHAHEDHNQVQLVGGSPFVIRGPGEYEVKGVSIIGISVFHDAEKGNKRGTNTIYRIEADGVSIVHLGDLGHPLTSREVEQLDGVDILMIPVGGAFTIDATLAASVVAEVEPTIVVPMHYKREGINEKTLGELASLQPFLKEMGQESVPPQSKLTVTKDKLPSELQVIVLK